MKQSNVINAYKVLQRISSQPLPLAVAYGLHKLKAALESAWKFQIEQEEKLITECNGVVDFSGQVSFPDDPPAGAEPDETKGWGESRERFNQAMQELSNLDADVDFKPVTLDAGTLRINLSVNDLADLEGFVEIIGT